MFLDRHLKQLVSTDFFVVPTVSFRVLFVFPVLAQHRRRVIHFNVYQTLDDTLLKSTQIEAPEALPMIGNGCTILEP
jgi:hypothetical protein